MVSWSYKTATSFCRSATSTGKRKLSFQVACLPAGRTDVCLFCVARSHSLRHIQPESAVLLLHLTQTQCTAEWLLLAVRPLMTVFTLHRLIMIFSFWRPARTNRLKTAATGSDKANLATAPRRNGRDSSTQETA